MSSEIVSYDLSRGLDIQRHPIKDSSDDSIVRISGYELMLPLASPTLIQNVHQSLNTADQLSGRIEQRVHHALLNDETEDPDITLVSLQWAGRFQDKGTQEGLAELLAANPNRRFLVYDNLGYGQSDAMPKTAAKELARTGRFDVYAEIVYGALSSIIKDHDKLDILGHSEGGLIGTELVPLAEGARSVVVFDPPSTPRTLRSLFNRFTSLEKAHGHEYLKALERSGLEMPEWDLSTGQILKFIAWDLVTGRIAIQNREARAMSVGAYRDALTNALPYIAERYIFLSPDQSEMNSPDFIRVMISKAARNANKLPEIVDQVTFNGTHAFAYGNPRGLTAVETHSLTYSVS